MAQQPLRSDKDSAAKTASSEIAHAHLAEADALQYLRQQQQLIDRVLQEGAADVEFHHRLDNDQDALYVVYYRVVDSAEVRAVMLQEIDSRRPSPRERMRLERYLLREISAGGNAWLELLGQLR